MSVRGKGSTVSPVHTGPEKSSPTADGHVHCSSSTNAGQSMAETAVNNSEKSLAPTTLDPDNSAVPLFRARTAESPIRSNSNTASFFSECTTGGPYTRPAEDSVG